MTIQLLKSVLHCAEVLKEQYVQSKPFTSPSRFKHEDREQGEFDVVSCGERSVVVHDARIGADCRSRFMVAPGAGDTRMCCAGAFSNIGHADSTFSWLQARRVCKQYSTLFSTESTSPPRLPALCGNAHVDFQMQAVTWIAVAVEVHTSYSFDRVFAEDATNQDVCDAVRCCVKDVPWRRRSFDWVRGQVKDKASRESSQAMFD